MECVKRRQMSISYKDWSVSWARERQYNGDKISDGDLPHRIKSVTDLWKVEIPMDWERENWAFLKQRGFRRGDVNNPRPEHKLERELFCLPKWEVMGANVRMHLYPELNEISLGNQGNGQRKIDVLALLEIE